MKQKSFIYLSIVILFLISVKQINAQNIFVAPNGSDINPGIISQPLLSLASAITKAKVGDTIFVRGGVFQYSATITISKSGASATKFYIFAYKNERPLLDFSSQSVGGSNRGIRLSNASYWHIKGLDIKGAGDNGMEINGGSNNIIEFCSFYENRDSGLQLSNGASNNRIINCDSYNNADPSEGNADGFAPKLTVGTGNYFYGCRAWQNSDDGWDGYLRGANDVTTILENCWSFKNGFRKDGTQTSGNGNGFKMGGGDNSNSERLMHHVTLKKCLAFDNKVKGFDQNNNDGSMTLLNCTGFRNLSADYRITRALNPGQTLIIKNSIAYLGLVELGNFAIQEKNSWLAPFNVTASDFQSIDASQATRPRKEDGSLPDMIFMHLASGSQFVDAGVDVGLPFVGIAPDLGAFEFEGPTSIKSDDKILSTFTLNQNFPNPFNSETIINWQLNVGNHVTLKVYDLLGREIATLIDEYKQPGVYNSQFSILNYSSHLTRIGVSQLPSGVYFYSLTAGSYSQTKKMIYLK